MSNSNFCLLTYIHISQEVGQVRWSGISISWLCFGIVNKTEIDVFLELSCFFDDPVDVSYLISDSSAFPKISLNIWKFTVHMLMKPGLENFEHYFTNTWDEYNCTVVWAFFGTAFHWDWTDWKIDLFQSCGHCWVFQFAGILSAALSQHTPYMNKYKKPSIKYQQIKFIIILKG